MPKPKKPDPTLGDEKEGQNYGEKVRGQQRDLHLILLGLALDPKNRDKIFKKLERPLPCSETEALFTSLEGDKVDVQEWLKRRNVSGEGQIAEILLDSVNKITLATSLAKDCAKACASLQYETVHEVLDSLKAAVETANKLLED